MQNKVARPALESWYAGQCVVATKARIEAVQKKGTNAEEDDRLVIWDWLFAIPRLSRPFMGRRAHAQPREKREKRDKSASGASRASPSAVAVLQQVVQEQVYADCLSVDYETPACQWVMRSVATAHLYELESAKESNLFSNSDLRFARGILFAILNDGCLQVRPCYGVQNTHILFGSFFFGLPAYLLLGAYADARPIIETIDRECKRRAMRRPVDPMQYFDLDETGMRNMLFVEKESGNCCRMDVRLTVAPPQFVATHVKSLGILRTVRWFRILVITICSVKPFGVKDVVALRQQAQPP